MTEGRTVYDGWMLGFGVELELGDGCSLTPSPTTMSTTSPEDCTKLELLFRTDQFPWENSFSLERKSRGQANATGTSDLIWNESGFKANTEYARETCISDQNACLRLMFNDTMKDGLAGNGYVLVLWNGTIVYDESKIGSGLDLELGDGCTAT